MRRPNKKRQAYGGSNSSEESDENFLKVSL